MSTLHETKFSITAGVRLRGDTLFVADAVYGLYSVNLNSRKVTLLVSPDSIDPPLGFADDLCLSKDGHFIYFSDASSKYTYYSVGHFILEGLFYLFFLVIFVNKTVN